jgi:hypothetical protein
MVLLQRITIVELALAQRHVRKFDSVNLKFQGPPAKSGINARSVCQLHKRAAIARETRVEQQPILVRLSLYPERDLRKFKALRITGLLGAICIVRQPAIDLSNQERFEFPRPLARSAVMSFTASSPTAMRNNPSLIPAASRLSWLIRACVVVAG